MYKQGLRKPSRPINPGKHIQFGSVNESFNDLQFCSLLENTPPSSPEGEEEYVNPVPTKRRVSNYIRPKIVPSMKCKPKGSNKGCTTTNEKKERKIRLTKNIVKPQTSKIPQIPKIKSTEQKKSISAHRKHAANIAEQTIDPHKQVAAFQDQIKCDIDANMSSKAISNYESANIYDKKVEAIEQCQKGDGLKAKPKIYEVKIVEDIRLRTPFVLTKGPQSFPKIRKSEQTKLASPVKHVRVDVSSKDLDPFNAETLPAEKYDNCRAEDSAPEKLRVLKNTPSNINIPEPIAEKSTEEEGPFDYFKNDTSIHSDKEFDSMFYKLVERGTLFSNPSYNTENKSAIKSDSDFDKIFNNLVNLAAGISKNPSTEPKS